MTLYPSVRAAYPSLILRSSFAQPSLNLRHILDCASSPTFLRSTFAQPSLKVRRKLGETSGGRGCIVYTFKCYKSAYYNIEVR